MLIFTFNHTGMNPEHQNPAEQECKEQQQRLIEPSNSQWACKAFYVNKRVEQARGKLIPATQIIFFKMTSSLHPIETPYSPV